MTGVVVLLGVVLLATVFGVYRQRTDGRLRTMGSVGTVSPEELETEIAAQLDGALPIAGAPTGDAHPHSREYLTADDIGGPLGKAATLVQFSSAFCAPCRSTRVVLDEISTMVAGVEHVEIDAEAHLDLVRRLDIRRTPTVLILDGTGAVRVRAAGAPRKADVIAALGTVM
jgi:thiol-disulfide isomerase/thioredoxin